MDANSARADLATLGFDPHFVASGMESLVFDVGQNMLAKVWTSKTSEEVQLLRTFYAQLADKHLPFATPLISEVLETHNGAVVSIEQRLPGSALQDVLASEPDSAPVRGARIDAVVSIVKALASTGEIPAARALALLGEPSPWSREATWGTVLADLVETRASRYMESLQRSVRDLPTKVTCVASLLNTVTVQTTSVIHGDICTQNVLVEPLTGSPTALLDFGFLTTSADPMFDAVVSALIFDMYSPQALQWRELLRTAYTEVWGQRFLDVYPLYKAAYALVTSNAYSEEGTDGHFQWCATILNDEETEAMVAQAR